MGYPDSSIWDDQTALATYYHTRPVSLRPNPGIIIASILVSILGSYACLTLLGRRTGNHGWRNHMSLGLGAVCFAVVGIFGMHFVSFQGFLLHPSPNIRWYLQFSPGFTAMSLFVPLISTWLAFYFLGNQDELRIWRIGVAGVVVGATIALMHYSASFQQPLYAVAYKAYTIVLAIIIAMAATTVAFYTFFRLRAHWEDNFWKRSACALVLASAVSGMHYCAVAGTSFSVRPDTNPGDLSSGKNKVIRITIAVTVMCGVIVLLSIGFAIWDYLNERQIRQQARKIVVASAAFDKQGRLLVRPDGTLPMKIIESTADLSDLLEELDPRQATFQWLYSLSFNWNIINPFIPRIRNTIARRHAQNKAGGSKEKKSSSRGGKNEDLGQFRSRFIEATYELAEEMELPMDQMGIMFDRVLTTGTRRAQMEAEKEANSGKPASRDDESSIHGITLNLPNSEGVMLFVVREIDDGKSLSTVDVNANLEKHDHNDVVDTVDKYLSKGYRLGDIKFLGGVMAERLQIGKAEMDTFLNALKTYAKRGIKPVVQSSGVYLGLYGVRPSSSRQGGVDVLVYKFARHQIPAYRLPEIRYPLSPMMKAWVREIANMTLYEVLQNANAAIAKAEAEERREDEQDTHDSAAEELLDFQTALAIAAEALGQAMRTWPNIYSTARISPEILDIPSSITDNTVPAQMIVLEVVLPSPMGGLTPSVSRTSTGKGQIIRPQSDKPPEPFVFQSYSLFSIAQAQILQGKISQAFGKDVVVQMAKLYPSIPTDVLAELDEVENPNAVDPFAGGGRLGSIMENSNFPHRRYGGSRGTRSSNIAGILHNVRRNSAAGASLNSAGYAEDDLEKGMVKSDDGTTLAPSMDAYTFSGGHSAGLKRFINRNDPAIQGKDAPISPAPAYSSAQPDHDEWNGSNAGALNPGRADTDG